jgi:parvulin-like peptidyl-prolyl isomerase
LPRRRHRGRIPTPAWERERNVVTARLAGRSPQFWGLVGAIALVVLAFGVIAYVIVANEIEDRNRPNSTAVRIDDKEYTLRVFTERLRQLVQQSGGPNNVNPQVAIQNLQNQLVEEQVFIRFAQEKGVSVTEDDIKAEIATLLGIGPDDPNYQARLQERLEATGLTEEQYREIAQGTALRKKLLEKFQSEVPASVEAIHYRGILVRDQTEADTLRAQVEGGADFAALAQEKSQDTSSKEKGGDLGWAPRGLLDDELEEQLFTLEVNEVITYPVGNGVWVYQVIEKDPARAVDDTQKSQLAQIALNEWISEKREGMKVEEFVLTDAENARYVIERVFPQLSS